MFPDVMVGERRGGERGLLQSGGDSHCGFDPASILIGAQALALAATLALVISHAAAPPWAPPEHIGNHRFLTPAEELTELALDDGWDVVLAEVRPREVTDPDGAPALIDDGVLLLRRS